MRYKIAVARKRQNCEICFIPWWKQASIGYTPIHSYSDDKTSQMTTQLFSPPRLHSGARLRFPAILQTMSKLNTHYCFYPSTLPFRVGYETTTYKLLPYVLRSTENMLYQSLIGFWVSHLQYKKNTERRNSQINLTCSH